MTKNDAKDALLPYTREPEILTSYVRPGIPTTSYDWCAQYADCEGYYAGWGGTKEAAIADLRSRYSHLWENGNAA